MNAVVTKPRAKSAKPVAVAQKPETTLAEIRSWILAADGKLEAAYDAAERGEFIDTLLDHICHSVIVEPVRLIQHEAFTQFDAKRVYAELFPVLACIQGAIKLAEGTVLQHTLEEAFQLLDSAQTELDGANSAIRALPLDNDDQPDQHEAAPTHSFEANGIEEGAYLMASEAIAIIQARAEYVGSDLVYGAIYVAERAHGILADGIRARDVQMCEDASAPLGVAVAVLESALHADDDVALHGALRLLELAKTSLDEAVEEVQ